MIHQGILQRLKVCLDKVNDHLKACAELRRAWKAHLRILLLDVCLHIFVALNVLAHNGQGSLGLPRGSVPSVFLWPMTCSAG